MSGNDVQANQKKIEAMLDWPIPKDISTLRGFLGLIGYYRQFVKNYDLIAKSLTNMLKKEGFVWIEASKKAFKELKGAMTRTPLLALSDFSKPFQFHTDASNEGIGAVYTQDRRPLAFLSKALGPQKKAWSIYARELLAITHAVKMWRPYLLGRCFIIITNQQGYFY